MGGLTPLSAAAYAAVTEVLRAAWPLPIPTGEVEDKAGYPAAPYGTLAYRMLRRAVTRGEAEQIHVPDMKSAYWRLEPACLQPGDDDEPRPEHRPACPTRKVTFTIYGRAQIDTYDAMCAQRARAPHELAYELVLDAIRAGQENHATQHLVTLMQDAVLTFGGPRSSAGRLEMLALLTDDPAGNRND